FFGRNREFEKGLGHAGRRLADTVAKTVAPVAADLVESGSAQPRAVASGTCDVTVRVRYVPNGSSSQNYILVLDKREESLGIKDGIAKVRLDAGPVVMHVSVKDGPYRVPVQDSYSANTYLDCSSSEHTLVLEIGAVGEGLLRWYP